MTRRDQPVCTQTGLLRYFETERGALEFLAEIDDTDVADLVHAVARAQAPIDPDRMKRRAVSRPSAGFAGELAGDDCPIRLGPATDRPQTTAAIGVLQQPLTIGEHDEILEQPEELLLL